MKVNLHTHTARCMHAVGADEDYVLAAIGSGYDALGFSDHTPFPYEDPNYINGGKMLPEDFPQYLASVLDLKSKHADSIRIYVGLECEPIPRFTDYLRGLRARLDYLILGNHGDESIGEPHTQTITEPEQLIHYCETTLAGIDTGLYLYIAHPDIAFASLPHFDDTAAQVSREICKAANRAGLPLEYNVSGFTKRFIEGRLGFPCDAFWAIAAEENCTAVIGVDAHRPSALAQADYDLAKARLHSLGLKTIDDPASLIG